MDIARKLSALVATLIFAISVIATEDIHQSYSDTAAQYEVNGNVVSNVDVTAPLWNPRGKSTEQLAARVKYLASKFDASISAEAKVKATDARRRYADAVFINTLLPASVGIVANTPEHVAKGLERNKAAGVTLVSATVVAFPDSQSFPLGEAMSATTKLAHKHDIALVKTTDDIRKLKSEGKMGLIYNAQSSDFVIEDLKKASWAEKQGMKVMNFTYNNKNALAGGGQDENETGLTTLGIEFVAEMNISGVVVDVSHSSSQAAIDAATQSTKPVIASHSNTQGLKNIGRNLSDEAIIAIGKTNGAVCTTGVGIFLNDGGTASSEDFAEHVVYTAKLIGREKTCFSTDYLHNYADMLTMSVPNVDVYAPEKGWGGVTENTAVEHAWNVVVVLEEKYGWSEEDIRGFLGENVMRVYKANWK
jgi:membrane dipeptidase